MKNYSLDLKTEISAVLDRFWDGDPTIEDRLLAFKIERLLNGEEEDGSLDIPPQGFIQEAILEPSSLKVTSKLIRKVETAKDQ